MNDEQYAHWLQYVRTIADALRLRDWDIELGRGGCESRTADACNFLHYGQKRCELRFGDSFYSATPGQQREWIVHELLHAHVEDVMESARLYINNNNDSDGLFPQFFQREIELLVDNLATAIGPFLPLPGLGAE